MKNSAPERRSEKVRMPPITTMASSSPEKAMEIGSAEVKRCWNGRRTPASPVIVAEITKAASL